MAKKKVIKGSRLRLLEAIVKVDDDLKRITHEIREHTENRSKLRALKKVVQLERNRLIQEAVGRKVPMTQIGKRLGKSKVAIFLIKEGDNVKHDTD